MALSAYFRRETRSDHGAIIIQRYNPKKTSMQIHGVVFEKIFDTDINMSYNVVVHWQRAGQYLRRTHDYAKSIQRRDHRGIHDYTITQRTSTLAIERDGKWVSPRYVLLGHSLEVIHLEGEEELKRAAEASHSQPYDERSYRLLALAHELTDQQRGRSMKDSLDLSVT